MVTLGSIFELLKDERRRYVLYYLYEQQGPVRIDELVEKIEEWEDGPERDGPDDRYERIAVDLKHTHLPKSAEVEFIQYHPDEGTVQIQGTPPKFDVLVTIARLIEEPDE
ncbi:DUF7344 domain-containing protein [Natrinema gelatinilyticum]|uniref:DUF7344 domain-containing protein n=1 Tax=Natrinema gelatinilyticum TaxID=2961571 RepID=UPI0020C49225|nr:hypothetical protein [Natrinema gelatinilyticum]